MTILPPLSLDDLTYEDLRLMALRRIPAASGGRWTHHAPVDGGVTLLELFAFLLEQQLFVLDQVPDSLTHAILSLLGEKPKPIGVARTVLAPVSGTLSTSMFLAAGTVIRPADAALAGLLFSTRRDTLLLAVASQEIFADGAPVSDRLERGEPVAVMSRYGAPGSVAVELQLLDAIHPCDAGKPIAVAFILEGSGVLPEWDAEAVDAPPPGPLTLEWSVPGIGGLITHWHDGTGGLRRSGLVTFTLPPEAVDAPSLRLTLAGVAAHAVPPRVSALAVGAAIAEHQHRVEIAEHATDNAGHDAVRAELMAAIQRLLPISGQTLDLPAALSPAIGSSLSLRLADARGTFHDWISVPDLNPMSPEDRVFTFDRARGRLSFGDGYAGRVPAPATNISLSVELGGGPEGEHASGMLWQLLNSDSNLRLVSLADAKGGTESETLESARRRIASSLSETQRAVTAEDYVTLAENAQGIGPHRAHVIAGHDPTFPCLTIADSLTVFVVPKTGKEVAAPDADVGALQLIADKLETARMLTTRVFVRRPVFRPVELQIDIAAATGEPANFADQLRPVLSDYLHPAIGGPTGTGWPFGRPLRPSEILRVARAALPRGTRVERVAIRLTDTQAAAEDCTELQIGLADLVRLDRLMVRVRRAAPPETTL